MVAVIGDLHGCFYTFMELLQKIRNKYPGIPVYSVGDLIDRGNFSFEIIEYFIREKIPFTPGNHDYMFYYFINAPLSVMGASWQYNGYEKTLNVYQDKQQKMREHLSFIGKAPLFFNLEDCFISHAGISKRYRSLLPADPLSDLESLNNILRQDLEAPYSILWARGELINIGKLQVVGHTGRADVLYNKASNVIYIDTSAYAGNKLTGVIINENKFVDVISMPTRKEDIE